MAVTAAQLILAAREGTLADVPAEDIRPHLLREALMVARGVFGADHLAVKRLAELAPTSAALAEPRRYKVQRPKSTRAVGGHIVLKTAHVGLDLVHVDVYPVDGALIIVPAKGKAPVRKFKLVEEKA